MADPDATAGWTAPPGFVSLPSEVDGVEVWGPGAAHAPAADGPRQTRCPQCGAAARFEVGAGALSCRFCGWADAQAPVVGTAAQAGEFTPEALDQGRQGFGVDRKELHCGHCGALLALDEGALVVSCPFCASSQVDVREAASASGMRPTHLVRFAVQPADARGRARDWLGRGWLHPSDLQQAADVRNFVGIYLPYWTFSASVGAAWEAEVGTERTERIYDHGSKTWKTRTEIVWNWRSGRVDLSLHDLLVAGTTKVSSTLLGRIAGFDLAALVPYDAGLLAGWQAQTYDVSLPDAWEQGRHRMRERARQACLRDTGSSHVRNLTVAADLGDEAWRHVLLPVYVSAYRFGEGTYVVVANGQSGEVAGQKPVAWWKVWTAIGVLLSPGLLCGLAGIPLLIFGIGAFLLIAALFLLIAGGAGSIWVYRAALDAEAL